MLATLESALSIAVMTGVGYAVIWIVFRLAKAIGVRNDKGGLLSVKPRPTRNTALLSLAILWLSFGIIGQTLRATPLNECSRVYGERRLAAAMVEETQDSVAITTGDSVLITDEQRIERNHPLHDAFVRCQAEADEYGRKYAFASVLVLGVALVAGRDAARKRAANASVPTGEGEGLR